MSTPTKPRPSFGGVGRASVPRVLSRATLMQMAIVAAIALYPSLPVTMAAFLALIQAAAAANAAAATRGKGLAAERNVKVDALWTAMLLIKTYVHSLCTVVDANTAISLIESAGLVVGLASTPTKVMLAATYVPATGIVHVVVNATQLIGKRRTKTTTFTWSWSSDGGKTWSSGVVTGYVHLDIPNLPPATYQFRVFATVGKVVGEPTQPVTLTLH
jgi:hypothetical protein